MLNFEERSLEYREYIEKYLADYYAQFHHMPQKSLYDAIEYSLLAGGKRLRPIFAFDFCRMAGGDWKTAAPFAAAIEMIHTYSLIHDDLPAMDDDNYRRGRLTNHRVFGEGMAILAGDALLTDAFSVASFAKLPQAEDIRFAINVLAQCAGSLGMVGGQALDIMSDERTLTEQEVLDIQSRKTGALINAACVLGVVSAGGDEEKIKAAGMFAGALGLAFQIRDDMLDVIGTQEEMGKGVCSDSDKNTFVRLYGLEKCEALVEKYTRFALKQLNVFDNTEYMTALAESLTTRRN